MPTRKHSPAQQNCSGKGKRETKLATALSSEIQTIGENSVENQNACLEQNRQPRSKIHLKTSGQRAADIQGEVGWQICVSHNFFRATQKVFILCPFEVVDFSVIHIVEQCYNGGLALMTDDLTHFVFFVALPYLAN